MRPVPTLSCVALVMGSALAWGCARTPSHASPRDGSARPGGPADTVVPAARDARPTLTLATLRGSAVIGHLGLPLGTLATLEGEVLPDDARRRKEDLGATLLRVESVGGKALAQPVVLHLRGRGEASRGALSPGKRVRFVGYETGAFRGAPPRLFEFVPAMTMTGYGFDAWVELVVMQSGPR